MNRLIQEKNVVDHDTAALLEYERFRHEIKQEELRRRRVRHDREHQEA